MKIKCPWFDGDEDGSKCEKYCRNEKELLNHIINYPHSGIAKKLAHQTFKIHERIESLENIQCMEGEIYLNDHNTILIKELKSLLEDKK